MMGFLKCPRSSWASELDAHPLSFIDELSYIFIALVHPLHGNPYSLTWIGGHLHSPLISRINVRLSPFLSSHTTSIVIFYSTIVLCPWLTLIYCVKVEWVVKGWVWNNCLACHRGCASWENFVWRKWSMAKLCDFVGISFFGYGILIRHNCLINILGVLLFLCQQ